MKARHRLDRRYDRYSCNLFT